MSNHRPTSAKEWNDRYPRGTPVKLYPQGRGSDASGKERPWVSTRTKGAAYHLSSGVIYIPIEGHGGRPISNVDILEQTAAAVV